MREMKDSGVEWIGEIPEDWNVGKTLYALSMPITDGPHETPELFDEGIPFISAEAVSCGNGHLAALVGGGRNSGFIVAPLDDGDFTMRAWQEYVLLSPGFGAKK